MSNPWDILILGCGRLGGNLKAELETEKLRVLGVRRSQVKKDATFLSLDLDLSESWNRLVTLPLSENVVIVAIVTPDTRTADAYRQRYVGISARLRNFASLPGRSHRVVWVSSTAVFGQNQIGLLDESVMPMPDHWRGTLVKEAEDNIFEIQAKTTVLRFAGLYTAQSLNRLRNPEMRKKLNPESVSNRIHRDDAVNLLRRLVVDHYNHATTPELVHGVDRGSTEYRQIFDRLDGARPQIDSAEVGRIISTRYRAQMPSLRHPTLDSVLTRP